MEGYSGTNQGRVSFKTKQQLQTYKNGKFELRCWTRGANKDLRRKKEYNASTCYESLDIPMHTMEFLCRSWSPTASNLLHTFSSPTMSINEQHRLERHEEESDSEDKQGIVPFQEDQSAKANAAAQTNYTNSASQANYILTSSFVERCIPSVTRNSTISFGINRRIKDWLREKSFTDVFMKLRRGEEKKKKKEEVRLLTAKVHAALSVAQLAAAIAGFAATNGKEISNDVNNEEMKMSNVVAYAAALLASACAEAAESAGATKAHVASAVNSGLASHSPADMITLSASAATSLRGAETLQSRAMAGPHSLVNKDPVKLVTKLLIITNSGQKVTRMVSVHLKHRKPMLSLEKKHLVVLTSTKEYYIQQVIREKKDERHYIIGIKCNGGYIKLLFEDKEQSLVWMSNISSFLRMYNS